MRKKSQKASATLNVEPQYATPALDKGLDVIELLARQPQGLTKSQLARELDRTVSEIFRMLLCLERRGYIAQLDQERYSLTLKMFQLAQEHPPTERLIVDSLPVMRELAHQIMQSCHLGVLEGESIVILAQVNAPTYLGFFVRVGSVIDMMNSASGYVILAHQSDAERERVLFQWNKTSGNKAPDDFAHHIARIRKVGYEERASYVVKGIVNISFPIFDERQRPVAALTIPYLQENESNVDRKQAIVRIRETANAITEKLGGRHPDRKFELGIIDGRMT